MKFPSQTFFFLPDFPPKVKVLRLTPKPSSQVLDRAISTFWTFIPDPTEFPSRLKLGTGKTAALISPLTAYILKGWKKKRLLTSPVWVFNLLGSISVKGSLEAFFFFSCLSLQCFFLCCWSVQPHWRSAGDLWISRAPQQIPLICTSPPVLPQGSFAQISAWFQLIYMTRLLLCLQGLLLCSLACWLDFWYIKDNELLCFSFSLSPSFFEGGLKISSSSQMSK